MFTSYKGIGLSSKWENVNETCLKLYDFLMSLLSWCNFDRLQIQVKYILLKEWSSLKAEHRDFRWPIAENVKNFRPNIYSLWYIKAKILHPKKIKCDGWLVKSETRLVNWLNYFYENVFPSWVFKVQSSWDEMASKIDNLRFKRKNIMKNNTIYH